MEQENWTKVKGHGDSYLISDLGRVKSLKYSRERILKSAPTKMGYHQVVLHKNGITKSCYIHRLVLGCFVGIPKGLVVDHIDNNKTNNKLSNLQSISPRENANKDRKGGSSEHRGVSWDKYQNKWLSRIQINGKNKQLGYFNIEEDARDAYLKALNKHEN